MKVVACYSIGTPYEQEAEILRRSIDRVGMDYWVHGFQDTGTWYGNTAIKAEFIRRCRNEQFTGPLLYVDVDAFVHENCEAYLQALASDGLDFACHWFAGPAFGAARPDNVCACVCGEPCSQEHRLLSGTLFFGDTSGARDLCERWVLKNEELQSQGIQDGGGQKNLWRTVVAMGDTLKMARLPGRFCRVFDKPAAYPADEPSWITHSIASRENRDVRGRTNGPRRVQIAEWQKAVGLR